MDIERAVEHLLELHARAEARMDRAEARMDRADARMDRLEKQLKATADLVRAGMKILIGVQKTQRTMLEAQQRTDQRIDRLARMLLEKGGNGRRG